MTLPAALYVGEKLPAADRQWQGNQERRQDATTVDLTYGRSRLYVKQHFAVSLECRRRTELPPVQAG